MPTATPFTALGKGNGFPFCPRKIDVSLYYKWVTLGGTQKGNAPTDAEKNASLINAMKLFWNAHELLGSAYSSNVSNPLPDIIYTQSSPTNPGELGTDPKEPRDRVCPAQFMNSYMSIYKETVGASEIFGTIAIPIARMYNGSTDNEANFVGYGMFTPCRIGADTSGSGGLLGGSEVNVAVQSFIRFAPPSSTSTDDYDDAYTTFAGLPVLSSAEAHASGNTSVTASANASSLTAYASFLQVYGGSSPITNSGVSSAGLTNIDFYTY